MPPGTFLKSVKYEKIPAAAPKQRNTNCLAVKFAMNFGLYFNISWGIGTSIIYTPPYAPNTSFIMPIDLNIIEMAANDNPTMQIIDIDTEPSAVKSAVFFINNAINSL